MKTLFVSDLDGTLLNSSAQLTSTTKTILNRLIDTGMLFTYASARSYHSAHVLTAGLQLKTAAIVHNGVFLVDPQSGELKRSELLPASIKEMIAALIQTGLYPIVYSLDHQKERFDFDYDHSSQAQRTFLDTRLNDHRAHLVKNGNELLKDDIYYVTLIDDKETLEKVKAEYQKDYHCVLTQDIYTERYWLEIMSHAATKAHAIQSLKKQLGCEKLIVFGDGLNDLEMFALADEAYAPSNAHPEVLQRATGIISSCDEDGVARFLEAYHE